MQLFTFKDYKHFDLQEIITLYQSLGWTNYSLNPTMLEQAYSHSLYTLAAYADDHLVGIIRVVGDGHAIIYIQDLLVLADYQRKGLGRALVERVLDKYKHVYQKVLLTEKTDKTLKFYESVGFIADYDLDLVAFGQFT